jgi:hypothetical protein
MQRNDIGPVEYPNRGRSMCPLCPFDRVLVVICTTSHEGTCELVNVT